MNTYVNIHTSPFTTYAIPMAYGQDDSGDLYGPVLPCKPFPGGIQYLGPQRIEIATRKEGIDNIKREYDDETELQLGQYYPRMYRGSRDIERLGEVLPRVEDTPSSGSFIHSLEQIENLFEDLQAIFRVVHPAMDDNLKAYGGAIRAIIILACTEVEAQWKGILQANNVTPIGRDFKTQDYVKLLKAMKLKPTFRIRVRELYFYSS
jgi:hypothetical protein